MIQNLSSLRNVHRHTDKFFRSPSSVRFLPHPVSSLSLFSTLFLSLPPSLSLSCFRRRPSYPTDKTSSSTPFLTPSPIPCHLYTIFLVIANIHLRRAPSISRYPNPRAHPCPTTAPPSQRRASFFGLHPLHRSQTPFAIDLRRLFARSRRAR